MGGGPWKAKKMKGERACGQSVGKTNAGSDTCKQSYSNAGTSPTHKQEGRGGAGAMRTLGEERLGRSRQNRTARNHAVGQHRHLVVEYVVTKEKNWQAIWNVWVITKGSIRWLGPNRPSVKKNREGQLTDEGQPSEGQKERKT
jgi:hypothetical protein